MHQVTLTKRSLLLAAPTSNSELDLRTTACENMYFVRSSRGEESVLVCSRIFSLLTLAIARCQETQLPKQSSREKSKLRDAGMQKLNRLWCPRGEICMKYRSLSSQMNAHILLDNTYWCKIPKILETKLTHQKVALFVKEELSYDQT